MDSRLRGSDGGYAGRGMILSPVERLLARKYLRARRGFISITTWFAIIGITLGVATLILVTSLMNGIREEMTSRFIGLDGHITIYSNSRAFADYQPAVEAIRSMPGILSVTPKVDGQVMVTNQGIAIGAQAMAQPWDALSANALIMGHVTSGSLDGIRDEQGVVLGQRLAENLHVTVGDNVTLISPQGRATIAGFIPRMKSYPVVGTVKLGMHEFDSGLVLLPFNEAQSYFLLSTPTFDENGNPQPVVPGSGAVSNLQVMVNDVNDASSIAQTLRAKLGSNARIYDWQQTNGSIFAALKVQRNVMVIILALIILVAAFNIISSLVMLVKEKGRDVAVLRTMGASRGSIMRIFMAAGTWIGVVGTVAGVGLGLILAAYLEPIHHLIEKLTGQELLIENIYFLSTLPTKTDPQEVIVIVLLSLALSFLATIYPARRAASLDPAEALRYE